MSTKSNSPTQNIMPSARPIRAAIVGTGYIADYHALAICRSEGVELVSVCDANFKRAQIFATNWGVPAAFNSINSMLKNQQVDCIHLLVPPDLHYPLAKTALLANAHVYLEKPMCVSVEQADDLCALAREHRLRLGVSHNILYSNAYQRLRELIRSRVLGPLSHISINYFLEIPQFVSDRFNSWMLRRSRKPLS